MTPLWFLFGTTSICDLTPVHRCVSRLSVATPTVAPDDGRPEFRDSRERDSHRSRTSTCWNGELLPEGMGIFGISGPVFHDQKLGLDVGILDVEWPGSSRAGDPDEVRVCIHPLGTLECPISKQPFTSGRVARSEALRRPWSSARYALPQSRQGVATQISLLVRLRGLSGRATRPGTSKPLMHLSTNDTRLRSPHWQYLLPGHSNRRTKGPILASTRDGAAQLQRDDVGTPRHLSNATNRALEQAQ